MTVPRTDSPLTREQRDAAFEAARVANLLAFASLTLDQKLQWLSDMLDLFRTIRPDFGVRPLGGPHAGHHAPTAE